MNNLDRKAILLKAKIEIGPRHGYKLRAGGLGLTLEILASSRETAQKVRTTTPTYFEGAYVIVTYSSEQEPEEEELTLSADEEDEWL